MTPELTLKGLPSCITSELYDSRVMTPESCIGSRECEKLLLKVGVGTRWEGIVRVWELL
jgi:hypothetical protein